MRRILFLEKTAPDCEDDVLGHTDYKEFYEHVQNSWGNL